MMGAVQKVFYFHVSSAWVGMLAFFLSAISGAGYMIKHNRIWDHVSESAVEIGLVFSVIGIISGSIWAKPIWNTWWTWDPRLTTTAIMVLIYLAYRMLRSGVDDPDRKARYAAIYAIVGFLSVPFTFFSIRLFRTIHPVVIGLSESGGGLNMDTVMVRTLVFCLCTFTVLFCTFLWHRINLAQLTETVDELRFMSEEDK